MRKLSAGTYQACPDSVTDMLPAFKDGIALLMVPVSHVQFNKEVNKGMTHKTNKLLIKKQKQTKNPKKAQH